MSVSINNNIKEHYCSFEISKLLTIKGLRCGIPDTAYSKDGKKRISPLSSFYDPHKYPILDCTHSIAVEFIRVNFGIFISVCGDSYGDEWYPKLSVVSKSLWDNYDKRCEVLMSTRDINFFNKTPQQAIDAALLYVLQNLI